MGRQALARTMTLPEPGKTSGVSVEEALWRRRSVRDFRPESIGLADIAQLLWAAQGLSRDDGLRTAPSAGALYPLEVLVAAGDVRGLREGVYRYRPERHALVQTESGDQRSALAEAAFDQDWIAGCAAVLAIAAVYERTIEKYGNRGGRYVHIEVGHAAQNVYIQAQALGLGTVDVGAFDDDVVRRILGLRHVEHPMVLLPVGRPRG